MNKAKEKALDAAVHMYCAVISAFDPEFKRLWERVQDGHAEDIDALDKRMMELFKKWGVKDANGTR